MSERTRVPSNDSDREDGAVLTERKHLRVLDLFAGTGSATQPFADRGHDVFRVELDEKFAADLHFDVRKLRARSVMVCSEWFRRPDFVWASPPCTSFSVGSFRHHWQATAPCKTCGLTVLRVSGERWEHIKPANVKDCGSPKPLGDLTYKPKSETGELGQELLRATLRLIRGLEPRWWVIENPRALMRRMPELVRLIEDEDSPVEMRTITHCQYGDPRRMKPTDLFGVFPDGFEARACKNGAPCHEAAPRGAKTGTQGLDKTESAMLPPDLGLELCLAMEEAL